MKNNYIIDNLNFLIKDYGCNFSFISDYGKTYLFFNNRFKLKIYEYKQLGELAIDLIVDMENYHIDPFLEEPKKIALLKNKGKGLRGLFYNSYEEDFWKIVSGIIKNKILDLL